ncbi:membrane protein FAM159A-like [Solea senegalensis]|uniref:Membrane protein FAM159A-like n=1 Tax=Solea senegalensis TaxID=28829 RepID=A0AAV6S948_SOLSE|nr:membrane protein FAM159A-like [Solea senegalensis]
MVFHCEQQQVPRCVHKDQNQVRAVHRGPRGFRKHLLRGKLDCDNQPPDSERCFMATVTSMKVEGPARTL